MPTGLARPHGHTPRVARAWRGRGTGVAWAWHGRGTGVAWVGHGLATGLAVAEPSSCSAPAPAWARVAALGGPRPLPRVVPPRTPPRKPDHGQTGKAGKGRQADRNARSLRRGGP